VTFYQCVRIFARIAEIKISTKIAWGYFYTHPVEDKTQTLYSFIQTKRCLRFRRFVYLTHCSAACLPAADCLAAVSDRYGLAVTAVVARQLSVSQEMRCRAKISNDSNFFTVNLISKKKLKRDFELFCTRDIV